MKSVRQVSTSGLQLPRTAVLAQRHARSTGLIYVSDAEPGIGRRRRGAGFCYIRPDQRRITSQRTLERHFCPHNPCDEAHSQRAFNRCVAATARNVAEVLGNTPAVCRRSYINPGVFTLWHEGCLSALSAGPTTGARRREAQALKLLAKFDTMPRTSGRK